MTLRQAILTQWVNKKSGKKEWALVSTKDHSRVLEWYGPKKPSAERVKKTENRIEMFKHMKGGSGTLKISAYLRQQDQFSKEVD